MTSPLRYAMAVPPQEEGPPRDAFSATYPVEQQWQREDKAPLIRLSKPNILVAGKHGLLMVNCFDKYVGASLLLYGEYSEAEAQFLVSLLRPGDSFIEVGAHIGAMMVALARAVGPGGSGIAIEPQPRLFRTLSANLEMNAISNVRTQNIGCGSREEQLYLPAVDYSEVGNFGGISLQQKPAGNADGEAVAVRPLDALAAQCGSLRLLKVDVEGMEAEVLRGARHLIERDRPMLYVENDRQERSAELMDLIRSLGYRLFWHLPPLFNPDNHFGVGANAFGRLLSCNLFCLPEGEQEDSFSAEDISRWGLTLAESADLPV